MALGQGLLLRPDVPRREIEDAPAPDRVLDGGAGDGVRRPRRRHGSGRGSHRRRSSRACSTSAARELTVLERDIAKLEAVQTPFPRITYDEAVTTLQGKGLPIRVGRRLRRAGRDGAVRAVRPAGDGAPLSGGDQGVLHEARSGAPRARARRRRAGARRATARSSAAASASTISICCCSGSRSTSCRRKRSSGTSICAATARCRTAASAWASSASWRGSAGSSTSARRFRSRACCTGCIRSDSVRMDHRARRDHGERAASRTRTPRSRHLHVVIGLKYNEDWTDLSRLSEEPRRLRGDARARPAGGTRADAGRRRRRRARRQHVRLHRLGEAGVDRRDPRDGGAQERRQRASG